MSLSFELRTNSNPRSANDRQAILADPGFGIHFTDHMAVATWTSSDGWHDSAIVPYGPFSLDPATAVLHYAQEVFEGLKAYPTKDGGATMFRPIENARRFQRSAERLAMPSLPEELFLEACDLLVKTDREWIPDGDGGSLYIRPFMFANEIFLGVKPSSDYLFIVIASSVGSYFKTDAPAVSLWVSQEFTRAAPGGTGAAKCGGNYASSLLAQAEATRNGCDQVVFLDAVEQKWVEELGGMNIFFVFDDGSMVTPPLGGTILPGITRSSLLTLAKDKGIKVREDRYSIDQWRTDSRSGRLREAFACGTAAVVTPIGTVRSKDGEFKIGNGGPGTQTEDLKSALVGIQRGHAADKYGWIHKVF